MAKSWLNQDTQIENTDAAQYSDAVAAGSTMESAATSLEDDLNNLRSQIKRYSGLTKWYDDLGSVRNQDTLHDDLEDIEQKRFLFRTQIITDIAVPASSAASGQIVAVAKANLIDTETFTLDDGVNAAQEFEFDVDGGGISGGGVQVDVSGDTSAIDVATRMVSAINGVGAGLALTASNAGGTSATVTIVNDTPGTHGNVTTWAETVADAGFVITQPTTGAGDVVVLSVAGSETPAETAAVGAATTEGAVVAQNTTFGVHSLAQVDGTNEIQPKTLCIVRDADTGDVISSGGSDVYALIQSESATNGHTFDDSSNRVMLSFVRENSTRDDLEAVPAADIGGTNIHYEYVRRVYLDNIPEDAYLGSHAWVDNVTSSSVTLDNAIDNQVGPATQTQDIDWDIADDYDLAFTADSAGTDLLRLSPAAAGDELEINIDTLDINNTATADFAEGIGVDSDGTLINIGDTAGQIDSAGGLKLLSGGSADLELESANDLLFDDAYRAGGGWSSELKLANDTTDWSDLETLFGSELSLLEMIKAAAEYSSKRTPHWAAATGDAAAGVNVTGAGGTPNLDAQLADYSSLTFVDDVQIHVNGVAQRPHASAATHDVYPGTAPATGDLKFSYKIKTGDNILMEVFA